MIIKKFNEKFNSDIQLIDVEEYQNSFIKNVNHPEYEIDINKFKSLRVLGYLNMETTVSTDNPISRCIVAGDGFHIYLSNMKDDYLSCMIILKYLIINRLELDHLMFYKIDYSILDEFMDKLIVYMNKYKNLLINNIINIDLPSDPTGGLKGVKAKMLRDGSKDTQKYIKEYKIERDKYNELVHEKYNDCWEHMINELGIIE